MRPLLLLLLATLLARPATVRAEGDELREARARYEALQYDEAITRATRGLKRPGLSREELIGLHEILGLAWVVLDDERAAAEAFDALLALDPTHALPRGTSPKLVRALEAARAERAARPSLELAEAPASTDDGLAIAARLVDPAARTAAVRAQLRPEGAQDFTATTLGCGADGLCTGVAPAGPGVHALFLEARDRDGRVLARVADPESPLTVLHVVPERPLWRETWFWVGAGALAAGVTIGVVVLASDDPAAAPDAGWGTLRF